MQLGSLLGARDIEDLRHYLDNSRRLRVIVEFIENAAIGDGCFANALVAHNDHLEVEVRWRLHLVLVHLFDDHRVVVIVGLIGIVVGAFRRLHVY